jgi:hypothetical protein
MAVKKSTLGARIDALYEAREVRLVQQRELNRLKGLEEEAEQVVIKLLQDAKLTKGAGVVGSVSLKTKLVPRVDPARWAEVFAYIAKKKSWALLYKRLNSDAYREQLGSLTLPGVSTETVLDLHLSRKGA